MIEMCNKNENGKDKKEHTSHPKVPIFHKLSKETI